MSNRMPKYIEDWLTIIEQMSNDNTYKLAWGSSIIQCCQLGTYSLIDEITCIDFKDIAFNMFKYYWNQTFFFNLHQSPNRKKPPLIYQITKEAIDRYCTLVNNNVPVWFNDGLKVLQKDGDYLNNVVSRIAKILKNDVSWRFLKVPNSILNIYRLNEEKTILYLTQDQLEYLKEYGLVLSQLLNYKWAQLLEKFNRTPRILAKVKGARETATRRSSLTRFKEILLTQFANNDIRDFYTNKPLKKDDIDVDHVIPWSFMYSDDIWNLVLTSKSYNRSKSNTVPNEEMIEKLKERNKALLNMINDENLRYELELSIEENYVTKYYYDFKR